MTACLDAWALIAFLDDEPAADAVEAYVTQGGCVMSWVNAGEVQYVQERKGYGDAVRVALAGLASHGALVDATGPRVRAAATLKARVRGVSFADCFAATTAIEFRVPLLTGDPGLLALNEPGLQVVDLRVSPAGA